MAGESETTREAFIASYVGRASAVGFPIEATDDGCIYLPDEDTPTGLRMIAIPCSCEGHDEGWHMEAQPLEACIAAASAWLQSDDSAYEKNPDAADRAAREMLRAADKASRQHYRDDYIRKETDA